jgi:hypothetical protein
MWHNEYVRARVYQEHKRSMTQRSLWPWAALTVHSQPFPSLSACLPYCFYSSAFLVVALFRLPPALRLPPGVLRLQQRARVLWETTLPVPVHALTAAAIGADGRHVLVAASFEGALCFVDQQRAVATAAVGVPVTCVAAASLTTADGAPLGVVAVGRLGGGASVFVVPRLPFETPPVRTDDGTRLVSTVLLYAYTPSRKPLLGIAAVADLRAHVLRLQV